MGADLRDVSVLAVLVVRAVVAAVLHRPRLVPALPGRAARQHFPCTGNCALLIGISESIRSAASGLGRAVLVSNPLRARLLVRRARRQVRRMPGLAADGCQALLNALAAHKAR